MNFGFLNCATAYKFIAQSNTDIKLIAFRREGLLNGLLATTICQNVFASVSTTHLEKQEPHDQRIHKKQRDDDIRQRERVLRPY